ncbi:MAG: hypothetical protein LBF74_05795 [Treponema sp.]|jgi:hypothetical protein|nr:hypothetical protein [Treponema sp.]
MNFIRRALLQAVLAGLLSLAFTAGVYAQNRGSLGKIAILPFSGGSESEREGIPELFMITREMMQNFLVMPRTSITEAATKEQSFQAMSGMTDADTIARLGNQFGADYVMAGSITSVGSKNLLIVSIVRIDVIRQVAGVYLIYDSLDELNRDDTILKNMAAELVEMARKAGDGIDKLALLPVAFGDGANRQEGDALAQILAIHLLRAGRYAVYPRTETLEQVQSEYDTQLKGGVTRTDEAVRAGEAVNPPYVLSVISRKIGTGTRFNASIIDLEGGYTIEGDSEQYATMGDGIAAMEFLARRLSGQEISQRERRSRESSVDSEERARVQAAEDAQRAKDRAAAADKFLRNSGIVLGGYYGLGMGGTASKMVPDESGNTTLNGKKYETTMGSSGSATFELRLYRYFGIQSGVTLITDYAPYTPPGEEEQYAKLNFVQIPILARLNFITLDDPSIGASFFTGVGMNAAVTSVSDADSASPGNMSFIAGAELFVGLNVNVGLYIGYQWNGGINSGSITANGRSYAYDRGNHSMIMGLKFYLPFRQ